MSHMGAVSETSSPNPCVRDLGEGLWGAWDWVKSWGRVRRDLALSPLHACAMLGHSARPSLDAKQLPVPCSWISQPSEPGAK